MMTAFENLHSFLHMGGYAQYVWPAYCIALLFLAINLFIPLRQRRHLLRLALKNNEDQCET